MRIDNVRATTSYEETKTSGERGEAAEEKSGGETTTG
jgi:hypothetical protein